MVGPIALRRRLGPDQYSAVIGHFQRVRRFFARSTASTVEFDLRFPLMLVFRSTDNFTVKDIGATDGTAPRLRAAAEPGTKRGRVGRRNRWAERTGRRPKELDASLAPLRLRHSKPATQAPSEISEGGGGAGRTARSGVRASFIRRSVEISIHKTPFNNMCF
jgi:hypothetical protein